jgi:cytochrome c
MNYQRRLLVGATVLTLLAGGVHASDEHGTANEAMALVKKASEYVEANGKEKAFADFNNSKGQFANKDLYIFVIDASGKMLSHGANAKMIDKNVIDLKDADDKYFIREFVNVANTKGKGWIDYKWVNPVNKAIEIKSSYVERHADLIIGCGIYKQAL